MTFLRFDNYETRNERKAANKLAPIRHIFDPFVNSCKDAYNPKQHLCVNQQLVPFPEKYHGSLFKRKNNKNVGFTFTPFCVQGKFL